MKIQLLSVVSAQTKHLYIYVYDLHQQPQFGRDNSITKDFFPTDKFRQEEKKYSEIDIKFDVIVKW